MGILGAETAFLGNLGIQNTGNDPNSGFSCSSLTFEGFFLLFPFLGSGIRREFQPRLPGVFGIRFSLENMARNGKKIPLKSPIPGFSWIWKDLVGFDSSKVWEQWRFHPKKFVIPEKS